VRQDQYVRSPGPARSTLVWQSVTSPAMATATRLVPRMIPTKDIAPAVSIARVSLLHQSRWPLSSNHRAVPHNPRRSALATGPSSPLASQAFIRALQSFSSLLQLCSQFQQYRVHYHWLASFISSKHSRYSFGVGMAISPIISIMCGIDKEHIHSFCHGTHEESRRHKPLSRYRKTTSRLRCTISPGFPWFPLVSPLPKY